MGVLLTGLNDVQIGPTKLNNACLALLFLVGRLTWLRCNYIDLHNLLGFYAVQGSFAILSINVHEHDMA